MYEMGQLICFIKGVGVLCYENEFKSVSCILFNMYLNYILLCNLGIEQCIDIVIYIYVVLIDSLKLLLRGGEGGLFLGDGGWGI